MLRLPLENWAASSATEALETGSMRFFLPNDPPTPWSKPFRGWVLIERDGLRHQLTKPPGTVAGERNCKEWLENLMRSGPPRKIKSEYQQEATRKFKVSIRGFARAWAMAITQTGAVGWSKPGRPGRKS